MGRKGTQVDGQKQWTWSHFFRIKGKMSIKSQTDENVELFIILTLNARMCACACVCVLSFYMNGYIVREAKGGPDVYVSVQGNIFNEHP